MRLYKSRESKSYFCLIINFLRWLTLMAQPFTKQDQLGVSMLTSSMLGAKNMKRFDNVCEHID